ncbi:MAG: hypothetical protein MUO73_00005, partial [Thermoplasmata archaeon]|nr:hypothetical protein [Thermoplasmata archaeon]
KLFRFLVTKDTLSVSFCTPWGGAQDGFQPSGLLYYMAHFIPDLKVMDFSLGILKISHSRIFFNTSSSG